MKKFAKVMSVALVAVLALAVLVACGPATDPQKATDALNKNGYSVTYLDSGKTADKIVLKGVETVLGIASGDLVARVSASKVDGKNVQTITIWYFNDASSAKKAWENNQDYFNSNKDEDSDWTSNRSGKIIYAGTEQAIKDAR